MHNMSNLWPYIVSELEDVADLLPEGESCDSDDELDEEYTSVQTLSEGWFHGITWTC